MAYHSFKQKKVRVSVPVTQQKIFLQNFGKDILSSLPSSFKPTPQPEKVPEDLVFQQYEQMPTLFNYEQMPTLFKKLPFAFTEEHYQKEQINKILSFSFKQQREEDIASCPGFVCCVVQHCLAAIGVPCSLEMGYRKLDSEARPHMWLNVSGIKVDNMYEYFTTKAELKQIEKSTPNCYQTSTFSYPKSFSHVKCENDFRLICYKKSIDVFMTEPDKGMALCLNQDPMYMYYFAMIRFMWENFEINLSAMSPLVRQYCWNCLKYPSCAKEWLVDAAERYKEVETLQPFQLCNHCMVARYCSTKCQTEHWAEHHRFSCVSRVSCQNPD